jgi:pyruvate formate lyase activating enzyme
MNSTGNEPGLIFHIIHGSFVDGYGTRTTVFLKGCPLRCLWCCNPEGQKKHIELKVTASQCSGCEKCLSRCPSAAISLDTEKKVHVDRALCTNCGQCLEVCFTGALDLFGKHYTIEELFREVKKDEQYYRASGGGVTIGGGEATCQSRFTLDFIRKCKENYIHTALDTCGYITDENGLEALEKVDLALFDIKGMDSAEHRRHTGVPNELILENLRRRDATRKPVIIRIPLIPGHTDGDSNLRATAEFLATLKSVDRVDLLAFHEFGKVKYEQLGMEYHVSGVKPVSQERLEDIKSFFERHGLRTQLGG